MEQERINELKAKYGKIYRLNINDQEWYYRAMSREEFKNYTKEQLASTIELTQVDLEDKIFAICNLNGITKEQVKNQPAGVIETIADAIMKSTGFLENALPEEL